MPEGVRSARQLLVGVLSFRQQRLFDLLDALEKAYAPDRFDFPAERGANDDGQLDLFLRERRPAPAAGRESRPGDSNGDAGTILPWTELLAPGVHVLTGEAGGGKTWTARRVVLSWLAEARQGLRATGSLPGGALPVLVTARELARASAEALPEAVAECLAVRAGGADIARVLREQALRFALVIDALDELSEEDAERFERRWQRPDRALFPRLLLTTRTASLERAAPLAQGVRTLELVGLSDAQQEGFVRRHCHRPNELLNHLRMHPEFRDMGRNPLLLSLLAHALTLPDPPPADTGAGALFRHVTVHSMRGGWRGSDPPKWRDILKLPDVDPAICEDRAQSILHVTAGEIFQSRPAANEFTGTEWGAAWARAAGQWPQDFGEVGDPAAGNPHASFLSALVRVGLVIPTTPRHYAFRHRRFLECFAAEHLHRCGPAEWEARVRPRLGFAEGEFLGCDPSWTGVLDFLAQLCGDGVPVGESNASRLIVLLREVERKQSDDAFRSLLLLQTRWAGFGGEKVAPEECERIAQAIVKVGFGRGQTHTSDFFALDDDKRNDGQWFEKPLPLEELTVEFTRNARRSPVLAATLAAALEKKGRTFGLGLLGTEEAARAICRIIIKRTTGDGVERLWRHAGQWTGFDVIHTACDLARCGRGRAKNLREELGNRDIPTDLHHPKPLAQASKWAAPFALEGSLLSLQSFPDFNPDVISNYLFMTSAKSDGNAEAGWWLIEEAPSDRTFSLDMLPRSVAMLQHSKTLIRCRNAWRNEGLTHHRRLAAALVLVALRAPEAREFVSELLEGGRLVDRLLEVGHADFRHREQVIGYALHAAPSFGLREQARRLMDLHWDFRRPPPGFSAHEVNVKHRCEARYATAAALEAAGSEENFARLERMLEDSSKPVVLRAAEALAAGGQVAPLEKLLDRWSRGDDAEAWYPFTLWASPFSIRWERGHWRSAHRAPSPIQRLLRIIATASSPLEDIHGILDRSHVQISARQRSWWQRLINLGKLEFTEAETHAEQETMFAPLGAFHARWFARRQMKAVAEQMAGSSVAKARAQHEAKRSFDHLVERMKNWGFFSFVKRGVSLTFPDAWGDRQAAAELDALWRMSRNLRRKVPAV